ncbi:M28 family metallopeptidase [Fibrella forsythiae]|uniref:M28 family peptidase n=1 Tax=Fibrella forsythiae TaxID=2817061 RepID=A0ABS3JPZ1_9BACT|nr:M28 family peptidase [Fibrella forsythiae]MBO0952069.1 M28 family peptidase [Fibrella forsythiae]
MPSTLSVKRGYLISGLIFLGNCCLAQTDLSQVRVSVGLLKKHVYALASDSLQGRETGQQGQRDAALYCSRVFTKSRLTPIFRLDSARFSYRQTYPFISTAITPYGAMSAPYGKRTGQSADMVVNRFELVQIPKNRQDSLQVSYGQNVAGLLIGTDLKKEFVIVSAHYDHLGRKRGVLYPGADDNASGTASVLSIAATFDSLARLGIRPRRSILFALFSGEEGGLIGSQYFVWNFPFSLSQIACDLNIDMVGRVDAEHRKKPDYCYLIAGPRDKTLRQVVDQANTQSVNMVLNRDYDTEYDPNQYYYRSDHYNFGKEGIPVIFFMDGTHPDYHRPSDTADKINYEVLQKRATLVLQTAWLLANQ